jgi:hypothetical protein
MIGDSARSRVVFARFRVEALIMPVRPSEGLGMDDADAMEGVVGVSLAGT